MKDVNYIEKPRNQPKLKEGINLISKEGYSGNLYQRGTFERDVFLYGLAGMYPGAKFILGVREKESIIKSLFSQYVKEGGSRKFQDFRDIMLENPSLDTDKLIRLLNILVGKENVHIYHFEKLLSKPEECISDMCNFIGVKVPKYELKKKEVHQSDLNKTPVF